MSGLCENVCAAEDHNDDDVSHRHESPMTESNDVNTPSVATTVLSIQQHIPDRQTQQQGRWHQQGAVVNAGRRNVYRTNSRRRYDLSPAVKRCVVNDKSTAVPAPAAATVADDTDIQQSQQQQQQQPTLFTRRYVINLDPLTPRPTVDHVRPGRGGNVLPATGTGKARWQRQQTTYQLTPRALRAGRTDVSAGARLTTRRAQTMTDENFLSATGKKLLDGSATSRNGESCRVIELNLNGAANSTDTSRKPHQPRAAATALSLHYSESIEHGASAATAGGIILPQLTTHR